MADNWTSPTNSWGSGWVYPEMARDESLGTSADFLFYAPGWSEALVLEYSGGLLCDKIRFYAGCPDSQADIDVYTGEFVDVFLGSFIPDVWNEAVIPAGPMFVYSAYLYLHSDVADDYGIAIEFDFNKVCAARPLVNGSLAAGRKGLA